MASYRQKKGHKLNTKQNKTKKKKTSEKQRNQTHFNEVIRLREQ